MPRVLILCEFLTLLGGERSMLSTLRGVQAAGFDVQVAAPPIGALADAVRGAGATLVAWETHDLVGDRQSGEQIRDHLAAIIAAASPDMVHANSLSTARLAGPVTAAAGVPSIGHLRDIVGLSRQAIDDLNLIDRLVAVSHATRDFHVRQGIVAEKCVVVNNGVELERFRPRQPTGYLHRELGIDPSAPLVATIGQLGMRKGTDVAFAAACRWMPSSPDSHWLVVGERTSKKDEARELEAEVRGLASVPPLAGRVHFLGSRDDVADLLPECELLIHAARQEPLGRVLLEAAACGLVVVATDVGGTREIFPSPSDGAWLVPRDDDVALAETVAKLLGDPGGRRSMGAAARRRAEMAFDVRFATARLIELYQLVLRL